MSTQVVCLPVLPDGSVGGGWGKAQAVALAHVTDGLVDHARIVKVLREPDVTVGAAGHMGEGMRNTITKMGLKLVLGIAGDARVAAIAAAS